MKSMMYTIFPWGAGPLVAQSILVYLFIFTQSVIIVVRFRKHVPKHCCGENNTAEGLQCEYCFVIRNLFVFMLWGLGCLAYVQGT